jgi:hypothetical protein
VRGWKSHKICDIRHFSTAVNGRTGLAASLVNTIYSQNNIFFRFLLLCIV